MKIETIKKTVKKSHNGHDYVTLPVGIKTVVFDDVAQAVSAICNIPYIKLVKPSSPFCFDGYYNDGIDDKDLTYFKILQIGTKAVIQISIIEQNKPKEERWITQADFNKYINYSDFSFQDE